MQTKNQTNKRKIMEWPKARDRQTTRGEHEKMIPEHGVSIMTEELGKS